MFIANILGAAAMKRLSLWAIAFVFPTMTASALVNAPVGAAYGVPAVSRVQVFDIPKTVAFVPMPEQVSVTALVKDTQTQAKRHELRWPRIQRVKFEPALNISYGPTMQTPNARIEPKEDPLFRLSGVPIGWPALTAMDDTPRAAAICDAIRAFRPGQGGTDALDVAAVLGNVLDQDFCAEHSGRPQDKLTFPDK